MSREWSPRVPPVDPRRPLVLGRAALWAFGATALAGSIAAWAAPDALSTPWRPTLTVVLQLAMVIAAARWSDGSQRGVVGYFALQTALAGSVLALTDGRSGIVLLPLLSQVCLVLPRWGVGGVMFGQCALFLASLATREPRALLIQAFSFLTAGTFTWLFTEVAMRERAARAEVEELADSLASAHRRLEQLTIERERVRLAREIHDGLGHSLTAARMQLEAARVLFGREPPRALESLEKASRLIQDGLAEVRQSVRALRETAGDERPLSEQLRRLCEDGAAEPGIELAVHGTEDRLSPVLELALFRAAQEALTNVRRHAGARRVWLSLHYEAAHVRLDVADDGKGPEALVPGTGLTGMAERLERHQGRMQLGAREGGGLQLRIEVPR